MMEAKLYSTMDNKSVQCILCAHRCVIANGEQGICRVRENRDGVLYTHVANKTIAQHVDPIEKKPLMQFYPGSLSYSIAAPGCNFTCWWCQNWTISQMPRDRDKVLGEEIEPDHIVSEAVRAGCLSMAYTYTEPTIFFEYAFDTAVRAHEKKLKNIFVTNGYMTGEMLEMMHPYLDAANVDLKSFRDATYRKYVGARLDPVLDSLKYMKKKNIWIEVTTLIIPGINDDPVELEEMASFISKELGPEVPWHINRFFPNYKLQDTPPTPERILHQAEMIGNQAGLRYIYLGNVRSDTDTRCYHCGKTLIERSGYRLLNNSITPDSRCPECATPIDGHGLGKGSLRRF
jgi:pyruvate formate lyase activating enzyme